MKALGLLFTLIAGVEASPNYSIIDLGALGGSSAVGFKINDAGTTVGWAGTIWGYQQAFRSDNGAPLQALSSLSASDSYAMGVNKYGAIAGTAYVEGQPHGVIWNGSLVTDLGAGIFVTGINDAGDVIGGNGHAFVSIDGIYQDLGVLPGGDWSSASGINQAGTVAGDSSIAAGEFRGFIWNSNTGMIELGTFGGRNSHATGINKGGDVIGYATLSDGYEHAFSYAGGIMRDLGTLGGSSYAYGINDAGAIVGYSWRSDGENPHAFLYLNGVMIDLNTLIPAGSGWELLEAYGINNRGEIVGEGLWDGQTHAFLMRPDISHAGKTAFVSVPEPGAGGLMGVSFALILVIVWMRRSYSPGRT